MLICVTNVIVLGVRFWEFKAEKKVFHYEVMCVIGSLRRCNIVDSDVHLLAY